MRHLEDARLPRGLPFYHPKVSLKWLGQMDNPFGRLARWAMELSQWDFTIKYRKGSDNLLADTLSRQPLPTCVVTSQDDWYHRRKRMVEEDPKAHPEYTVKNGRLYRLILHTLDFNEADSSSQWKICVPRAEQGRVLKEEHDEPVAGHLGIAKTLARLARKYYWPGMLRTAAKYVRTYPSCQRFKTQQQAPAGKMHATNVEQPWGEVSVDWVGPLPRSTAGHAWLLVMQDRCTKWVELRPIRRATGRAVAEPVRDQICLRHGCPDVIVTDNGRQFTSHVFDDLPKAWHVKHKPTLKFTPHCNPVERTNWVIKTMIAQSIAKNQKTWDRNMPELTFAYNTAQHGSTGHSPAYLNHFREIGPQYHWVDQQGPTIRRPT